MIIPTRPFLPLLAIGLLEIVTSSTAQAQFYGGSTNYASGGSQAYARSAAGLGGNASFSCNPYIIGGMESSVATPWSSNYGSWIQPSVSANETDEIGRSQAIMASRMMYQDLKAKRLAHRRAVFDEMKYSRVKPSAITYGILIKAYG